MEDTLKRTCLYGRHVALGAKMSPFGGFDMPIQYSSIINEHNAVRTKAGLFDVSHMGEIFVDGSDALDYINSIFTNDIIDMPVGKILYGMMCYPDGGVVDDLLVYYRGGNSYLLVVNASNIDKDYQWMLGHLGTFDCKLVNDSENWGQVALQGPDSEKIAKGLLGMAYADQLSFYTFTELEYEGVPMILSRTGYTGEDGFEIYTTPQMTGKIWDKLLENGVEPCGLGCRDTLRFEAGLPLYGHELSENISPVMAGLSLFCKLDKSFIGRDALDAQKQNGVAKKLVGIELEESAVARAEYPVELEDGTVVGVVTTGYHSISLSKSICFALVDNAYAALGTSLWIRIRKKVFKGSVVKKRFYSTNYKK